MPTAILQSPRELSKDAMNQVPAMHSCGRGGGHHRYLQQNPDSAIWLSFNNSSCQTLLPPCTHSKKQTPTSHCWSRLENTRQRKTTIAALDLTAAIWELLKQTVTCGLTDWITPQLHPAQYPVSNSCHYKMHKKKVWKSCSKQMVDGCYSYPLSSPESWSLTGLRMKAQGLGGMKASLGEDINKWENS